MTKKQNYEAGSFQIESHLSNNGAFGEFWALIPFPAIYRFLYLFVYLFIYCPSDIQ